MSKARYPDTGRHVIEAIAELADREYQQRLWIERQYPTPTYCSDLVAGDEVERLRNLGVVLDQVIDELYGEPDAVRLSHPQWPEVVRRAGLALAAMARNDPGWPAAGETG